MDGPSRSVLNAKEVHHWILWQFTLPRAFLKNTFKDSVRIIGSKIVEYVLIARLNEEGEAAVVNFD
jgi:hypothetical protein